MSRIGRMPVKLEKGVTASYANKIVSVKGPLGSLTLPIANEHIEVNIDATAVHVVRNQETKEVKAAHGLYRALIHNMVVGVTKGYSKGLIINGVGYKATKQGDKIVLSVGFSHNIDVVPPKGITVDLVSATELLVKGIDKDAVGQFAANVKSLRKPEPYHGYGIRYKDETILRKAGKTAGK